MKAFSSLPIWIPLALATRLPTPLNNQQAHWNVEKAKVQVQLGVMSQCPDALLCESRFNDVLERVAEKVDLSLVYIGRQI